MFLFCSRIPVRTPHYIWSSSLLTHFLAVTVFRLSLFFMTLIVLKSAGQVCQRTSLHFDLSGVFLMNALGLWFWRKKATEVKCHSIMSYQGSTLSLCLIMVDTDLDHLAEVVSPGVSTVFPSFPSFAYWALWKEVTKSQLLEGRIPT